MHAPTFIFAGGGTGGHLYPALAVAEALRKILPEANVVFACSDRPIDQRVLGGLDYSIIPQPVRPLPTRLGQVPGFLRALWSSRRLAERLLSDLRPAAVLGMGGFAAAPVVDRAAVRHTPTALLNPDAVPGKANQYLAKRVEAIFTQFQSTTHCFPEAIGPKVRCVGCPVRSSLLSADRDEAVAHFGLDAAKRTLLVCGGSLGAESINQAVLALRGELEPLAGQWQVLHVTGPDRFEAVRDGWAGTGIKAVALPYCQRMDLAYAAASLVLCRGGAATIAELSATGSPAVILPYPYHRDDHQRVNASELAACGGAVVVTDHRDPAATAGELKPALLAILGDSAVLDRMRATARQARLPDAGRHVARWLADRVP